MAQRMAPSTEIFLSLGLTERQFRQAVRFKFTKPVATYLEQFYAQGRYILRQEQFKKAEQGNVSMLRWLGMQHLGQRANYNIKNDDENPVKARDSIPTGYRILTPGGDQITVDAMGNRLPEPKKPHDEQPIVEAIILSELEAPSEERAESRPASKEVIVVSGHAEDI